MRELETVESELRAVIVEALVLEHVSPSDIDPEAPLFFEGLGLDSIDALELGMALESRYGIQVGDDPQENAVHFASLRSLAAFVASRRVR